MQFLVERALDESQRDWEEIGATDAAGFGADTYAVEQLAVLAGHLSRSPCRAAGRDSDRVLGGLGGQRVPQGGCLGQTPAGPEQKPWQDSNFPAKAGGDYLANTWLATAASPSVSNATRSSIHRSVLPGPAGVRHWVRSRCERAIPACDLLHRS